MLRARPALAGRTLDARTYRRAAAYHRQSRSIRAVDAMLIALIVGAVGTVVWYQNLRNELTAEEVRWARLETSAFQPYAVASAIAAAPVHAREDAWQGRLWQAAVALDALDTLERDVRGLDPPQDGLVSRWHRLERARRLALGSADAVVREIVGGFVWPLKAGEGRAPPSGIRADRVAFQPFAALARPEQACIRGLLQGMDASPPHPVMGHRFALARATPRLPPAAAGSANGKSAGKPDGTPDVNPNRGRTGGWTPLLLQFGAGEAKSAVFGAEAGGRCIRIGELQDAGGAFHHDRELRLVITSAELFDTLNPGQASRRLSIYGIDWYAWCANEPAAASAEAGVRGGCAPVWRADWRPVANLLRERGSAVHVASEGLFFLKPASGPWQGYRLHRFPNVRPVPPERIEAARAALGEADAEAGSGQAGSGQAGNGARARHFEVVEGRAIRHRDSGRLVFASDTERVAALASADGHLAFVYRGAGADAADRHAIEVLSFAGAGAGAGAGTGSGAGAGTGALFPTLAFPIVKLRFLAPPVDAIAFGGREEAGGPDTIFLRARDGTLLELVWRTAALRERVCAVLQDAGTLQRMRAAANGRFVEDNVSDAFKMLQSQEDGVIDRILDDGGPCRTAAGEDGTQR
jgi:hypothetical protein